MSIISELTTHVTAWLTFLLGLTVDAVEGILVIFWDDTTGFTIPGILLLMGLAMAFLSFAFGFIMRLIRR